MVNPFLPRKRANAVIVDGRVKKEIFENLEKLGLRVIPTIKCEDVHDAISYHPDICIHPINSNTLVIAPNVFEYYDSIFKNTSIKLIKGEKHLQSNYPNDIAYNVARVARYAIHNTKYTDEKLAYYLKKEGIEFIDVNQGYSKCSTAIIDDNAIITSDPSIKKECERYDIDILYIKEGHIKLPGFDYGFIGGATGNISKNEILITGRYDEHPNNNEIEQFFRKMNKNVIFLSKESIMDVGSIIPLIYN